jgi:hypothetical protein
MIPFRTMKLSEAVDPIKIYEYLYFGLPVIVKGIPHLKDLPGVSVVESAAQFVEAVQLLRQDRKDAGSFDLQDFTWDRRFSKLLKLLEGDEWMSL